MGGICLNNIKYFDHAATTGVKEAVLKEMLPYFNIEYGNASSIYGIGRRAKRAIEEARGKVAKVINANTHGTSGSPCFAISEKHTPNIRHIGVINAIFFCIY